MHWFKTLPEFGVGTWKRRVHISTQRVPYLSTVRWHQLWTKPKFAVAIVMVLYPCGVLLGRLIGNICHYEIYNPGNQRFTKLLLRVIIFVFKIQNTEVFTNQLIWLFNTRERIYVIAKLWVPFLIELVLISFSLTSNKNVCLPLHGRMWPFVENFDFCFLCSTINKYPMLHDTARCT